MAHKSITTCQEMNMKKIVLATALIASVFAHALAANAGNQYIDPHAPFNAARFFETLPTGQ